MSPVRKIGIYRVPNYRVVSFNQLFSARAF